MNSPNNEIQELPVGPEEDGTRLDVFVAELSGVVSRSAAESLITKGAVLVDGTVHSKGYRLRAGETVEVTVPKVAPSRLEGTHVPFELVYEDEWLAVVDKPAGVVVHPGPGNREATLVHGLIDRLTGLSGIGGVERPGIVHRLDKDTSGLMIVAKEDRTHIALSEQMQQRRVKREYLALLDGDLPWDSGDIDAPIGRDPHDRKRMTVIGGGKNALTYFEVTDRFYTPAPRALLKVRLATGRTHQIRVHFAHLGYPVAGDITYGGAPLPGLKRHFLHACRLSFLHPITESELNFESNLPAELQVFIDSLRPVQV